MVTLPPEIIVKILNCRIQKLFSHFWRRVRDPRQTASNNQHADNLICNLLDLCFINSVATEVVRNAVSVEFIKLSREVEATVYSTGVGSNGPFARPYAQTRTASLDYHWAIRTLRGLLTLDQIRMWRLRAELERALPAVKVIEGVYDEMRKKRETKRVAREGENGMKEGTGTGGMIS